MSDRDTQQGGRVPDWWVLARDILMFFGGWTVIFWEVSRPDVRESVLLLAGSAIAVPGLYAARAAVAAGRSTGTGEPSPPSPEVAPSSSVPPSVPQ